MRRRRGGARWMPAAHGATVNGRLVGRTARLAEFLSLSFHSFTRTRAVKRGIGHMPLIRAEVAKRQTQRTQNPPSASSCGFKSRPRHQEPRFQFFPGGLDDRLDRFMRPSNSASTTRLTSAFLHACFCWAVRATGADGSLTQIASTFARRSSAMASMRPRVDQLAVEPFGSARQRRAIEALPGVGSLAYAVFGSASRSRRNRGLDVPNESEDGGKAGAGAARSACGPLAEMKGGSGKIHSLPLTARRPRGCYGQNCWRTVPVPR